MPLLLLIALLVLDRRLLEPHLVLTHAHLHVEMALLLLLLLLLRELLLPLLRLRLRLPVDSVLLLAVPARPGRRGARRSRRQRAAREAAAWALRHISALIERPHAVVANRMCR